MQGYAPNTLCQNGNSMKAICVFVLFGIVGTLSAQAAGLGTPAFKTAVSGLVRKWTNELGSTLEIQSIDPATGKLTGTYASPSGTTGQTFPLVGAVNYEIPGPNQNNAVVVTFSVHWGSYGSITTWNGTFKPNSQPAKIRTQWILVRSNSNQDWDHTLLGSDIFSPAP
jgi:hypothetical protein